MSTQASTVQIFDQITRIERELQRLKVDAYFSLPQQRQQEVAAPYAEHAIVKAVRTTRDEIWRERYGDSLCLL